MSDASGSLLCNAIIALSKSDYAAAFELVSADIETEGPLRAKIGTWALGRLLLEQNAPTEMYVNVGSLISRLIENEKNAEIQTQAIYAATNAMHLHSMFDTILKRLAKGGNQDVLAGVAKALFIKADEIYARCEVHEWLSLMVELTPEYKGGIDNLDNAMARLLTQPTNISIIVATLKNWAAKHGKPLAIDENLNNLFSNTIGKLSKTDGLWAAFLTDWLLSDSRQHAACIAGILHKLPHQESHPLCLDKQQLDDLDEAGLLFLVRRMLGYVYDRSQLTSMAMSMLESSNAKDRIFPLLHLFLVDEIGYDYPASTIQACKNMAESCPSADSKRFLADIAETLEEIGKNWRNLPRLNELKPSMKLRRQFFLARTSQMNISMEDASKKSIWRQIATEIPIKAGRSIFSYRDASYGEPMQLSSFSQSIEMPRREVSDPIGNAIRLLNFRRAKRGE